VSFTFGILALQLLVTVPAAYALLARGTGSPGDVKRKLDAQSAAGKAPAE